MTTQLNVKIPKRFYWICRICTLAVALSGFWPEALPAGGPEPDAIKAAFTVNFAKFTQWPEEAFAGPSAPIELCVWGNRNIRRAFGAIEGKTVGHRRLHVRFMQSEIPLDRCHILFFDKNVDRSQISDALAAANGRPVLTIGETTDFIDLGGAINIFRKKDRFQFEINPDKLDQQGLKVSSRLLKLAIIVGD